MFSLGLSWDRRGLHVYLRVTRKVLTVVLTAWFWLEPIFLFEDLFTDRSMAAGRVVAESTAGLRVRGTRDMVLPTISRLADVLALAGFSDRHLGLGGPVFPDTQARLRDVL